MQPLLLCGSGGSSDSGRSWKRFGRLHGCFQKIGGKPPKWMVNLMESLLKMDDLGGTPIFGHIHVDMDLLENLRGSIWSFWPLDPSNPWTQPFLPSLSVINRGAIGHTYALLSHETLAFLVFCVRLFLLHLILIMSSSHQPKQTNCPTGNQPRFSPVNPSQCGSNSILQILDFLRRKKKDLFWHRRNMLHACFEKSSFILFIAIQKVTPNRTKTHFFPARQKESIALFSANSQVLPNKSVTTNIVGILGCSHHQVSK